MRMRAATSEEWIKEEEDRLEDHTRGEV